MGAAPGALVLRLPAQQALTATASPSAVTGGWYQLPFKVSLRSLFLVALQEKNSYRRDHLCQEQDFHIIIFTNICLGPAPSQQRESLWE